MSTETLRIATRGSLLALWQANWVKERLQQAHPGLSVELLTMKTRGDKILDVPLAKVGGKGLFVKELEEAMLEGRADLAVHSMKDVPAEFPEGLGLGPVLQREDPRDALLSVHHAGLQALPEGAKVGSSSLRRQSQLLALRPDLKLLSLRGNVNTRIRKLEEGEYDAIVLAAAGVKRLGTEERVVETFDIERMLPAVGQGAVGIEYRLDDSRTQDLLAPLNHRETALCVQAERAFLTRLEGGCQVPIAGHATLNNGGEITLQGRVADLTGQRMFSQQQTGRDPESLGVSVAEALLGQGADAVLKEVYAASEPS
ncbi:MAG: hydroxymethylbilane synthase [Magnetococcales bacterium]|nr:hydroxymethylbilane synthase [Magnetococcales bacterium]